MASRKKQNTPRKRDGIHFVNARPASETERLKAQRLVRAHVGRWISDQTKDRATASEHPSSSARRSSRTSISINTDPAAPSSSFPLVSHPPPYTVHRALPIGTAAPRPVDWPRSPFPPFHRSDSSDSSSSDGPNAVENSATNFGDPATITHWNEVSRIEPVISGFVDPFSQYPSNYAPDLVNLCESYCLYPSYSNDGRSWNTSHQSNTDRYPTRHNGVVAGTCTQNSQPTKKGRRELVPALAIRPSALYRIHVWIAMPSTSPMVEGLGSRVELRTQAAAAVATL